MAEKKEIKKVKRAALYLSTEDTLLLRNCVREAYSVESGSTEKHKIMMERLDALDRVIELMPDNL